MVEVLALYSNQTPVSCSYNKFSTIVETTHTKTAPDQAKQPPPPTRQKQRRLTDVETRELIQRYEAGETVYQLGDAYNINRKTVSRILKRNGITTRWRKLTPNQINDAIRLYESGLSLQATADRIGVNHSTIRWHLEQRGITRREVGTNQWS